MVVFCRTVSLASTWRHALSYGVTRVTCGTLGGHSDDLTFTGTKCRQIAINCLLTMGILMSKVFEGLFGSKQVRILILGLDNAGKTTILYRLQNESDEAVQTIPTIGFNVETLQYKNIKVRWLVLVLLLLLY